MKTLSSLFGLVAVLLLVPAATTFAVQVAAPQTNDTDTVLGIPKSHLAPLSAGLDDVLKLSKSGVDESVINAYVKTSSVASNPTAEEILKLKENGVSAQVIVAILQRGGEVRQQIAKSVANQASQPISVAPAAPRQQVAPYSAPVYAQAPTVVYANPYPVYTYPAYSDYWYDWWSYPTYPIYYSVPRANFHTGFLPRVSVGVHFGNNHFGGHVGGFGGGHIGGSGFGGGGRFNGGHVGGGFRGGHR